MVTGELSAREMGTLAQRNSLGGIQAGCFLDHGAVWLSHSGTRRLALGFYTGCCDV